MQVTLTREFACTPERLFSFLEEPEKQKQWMKGLLETQAVGEEQPGIVGSKFRMKIKEGRKVADYDGVITAYDKPKQLAIDMTGPTFPAGAVMHVDYRLADLGGRTRLDYPGRDGMHAAIAAVDAVADAVVQGVRQGSTVELHEGAAAPGGATPNEQSMKSRALPGERRASARCCRLV
jgi:carbon monoxide dehydrogenase subunit G